MAGSRPGPTLSSVSEQRRSVFLTMDDTAGWSIDADLAIPPLTALGWRVDSIPWRSTDVAWSNYEAVYVGTPWDYPQDPQFFLEVLQRIDRAGCVLANPLPLLRWNLRKTYLQDLQQKGAQIVPTVWFDSLQSHDFDGLFERCCSDHIIVKPVVSTNATDTFLLPRALPAGLRRSVLEAFARRACMAQPFVQSVLAEGEFSLFYLGGELSHAIQKRPKSGDFRVQEEHGASIESVAVDAALQRTGDAVMALLDPAPVYARVDFVRSAAGRLLLMELELVEPSMYLRMDAGAPERFARAFDDYVGTIREQGTQP